MGNAIRRQDNENFMINERAVLKKVWDGISDNPQYHGNVFFLEFCKTNPQYTKYFTLDPEMPLTIDVNISMHFSIIMETMGYLMVDYYKNQKQHNYYVGYIAMVHKDMNLFRRDMFNFATCLIEYLTVTFPMSMTPECHKIVSRYIFNLVNDISKNIEDLRRSELSDHIESERRINSPFIRWISCQDNLIYGKTTDFWAERKRVWMTRLEEWKRRTRMVKESCKNSSTSDDDTVSTEELNEEMEMSQSNQSLSQLSKSNGSSIMSSQILSLENLGTSSNHPSITLRTKKPGETKYNIVETINRSGEKFVGDSEFELSFQNDVSSTSSLHDISDESSLRAINNIKIDSIARKRRRERNSIRNYR